jgi:uncharacterized protein YndB with AHSA1/START domain
MTDAVTDRIEKSILLRAPRARVWRALTDPAEFGTWFGVKMPAGSFVPGGRARGVITSAHPDYEGLPMEIVIDRMEAERLFSWRWHPGDVDKDEGRANDPMTLVVFTLEDAAGGTLLKVVESGFDGLPDAYRVTSRRLNDEGWTQQLENIEGHVSGAARRS